MSVACGLECVFCVGFSRWAWKRCTHVGSDDSATWTAATPEEFEPIPRICRVILAVYEPDLRNPKICPSLGSFDLNPDWVIKRVTHEETQGRSPPYIIYVDHNHREIVLAIRGLNLAKEYDLVFAGHSLGSGVAALMAVLVVTKPEMIGGIPRCKIRCFALAPARCMSLNLAVKYADVIFSVILQDDFLPRTATPLEDIFKSIFCLPCLLFLVCLRDTFIPEGRKLRDPRRLYAPGRIYHIVERKFCRY